MKTNLEALDGSFAGYDRADEHQRFCLIYDYVHTLCSCTEDGFPFALLLVSAMGEGANPKTLADFTGVPLDFINEVCDRMTAAGMWLDDGLVDYEFLAAAPGHRRNLMFATALLVAQGLLAAQMCNGRRLYRITEAGRCAVELGGFGGEPAMMN